MRQLNLFLLAGLFLLSQPLKASDECEALLDSLVEFVERPDVFRTTKKDREERFLARLFANEVSETARAWKRHVIEPEWAFSRVNELTMDFSRVAPFKDTSDNRALKKMRLRFEATVGQNPGCAVTKKMRGSPIDRDQQNAIETLLSGSEAKNHSHHEAAFDWFTLIPAGSILLLLIIVVVWLLRELVRIKDRLDRHREEIRGQKPTRPQPGLTVPEQTLLKVLVGTFPPPVSAASIQKTVEGWTQSAPVPPPFEHATPTPTSTPTPAPMAMPRQVVYAQPPTRELGTFGATTDELDPNGSFFRIEFERAANEGSFTVVDDASMQERAIRRLDDVLIQACKIEGDRDKSRTSIRTLKPGRATRENGQWKVVEPAKIELL